MIGEYLGGRYEVQQQIGGGGMAVVYKALDHVLNRSVAVKVLRAQFGHDEDFIRRFRREAQAAASLSHPNVVNIYDVGEDHDVHFIVMEYVEGPTLKELIKESAPLDVKDAVNYARQICEALDHAHQNQIIHRDIKPHNILINKHRRVKVTDFGIARAVTSATITHTGSVLGSVHYFSPEQAKGSMTGEKSDIYSLGVVLYEMVTGELPFSGDSPISVALKHLQESFIPPRKLNPEIPQSLENIIRKSLAKNPLYRYTSAKEMMEDLETCLLPERKNELPLYDEDTFDEEATRVMPAIPGDIRDTMVYGNNGEEEDDHFEQTKKAVWMRSIAWLIGIVLLITIGVLGFAYAKSIWYVPDVTVPPLINMSQEQAFKELEHKKLHPKIIERYDNEVDAGLVAGQEPAAGMVVKRDSEIILYVSQGKQAITMPDLRGLSQRSVENQLMEKYKFKDIDVKQEYSDEVEPDKVISHTPGPKEKVVPEETALVLVVSKGAKTIPMPSLIGLSENEAAAILEKNGLKLNPDIGHEKAYMEKNKVFWQFPYNPGDEVSPGTEISIKVSNGYPDEAKVVRRTVKIELEDGKKADVTILVTDARGKEQMQINQTIDKSASFSIELVLSPEQNGYFQVYVDGSLLKKNEVSYGRAD